MDLPLRETVIEQIVCHASKINSHKNLNKMVMIHEIMLSTFYAKKPLFYKMIFKSIRFYTAAAILLFYYCDPAPTLKKVKNFISQQENFFCANSINALFTQLRVSGRLTLHRAEGNRREKHYLPSPSAIKEIFELLQTLLKPYQILHSSAGLACYSSPDEFIRYFFCRYQNIVLNHITLTHIEPNAGVFIKKDGGYMIMLLLYKEHLQQNSQNIILPHKKIAEYSYVSRSHVCALLHEAQSAGLLSLENNLFIRLSDNFIHLFRNIYSLQLAGLLYCICPEHKAL
ncbi:hypothetical protein [Intestinirhabdus alba]|uniref:Uncharacterized protein n=1 Tax=Intestinirhabdus alba TaxID=2899544 RepID=A0A6L6IGF9_9ENTR|nr:hypothetical protein [Intestinirhabdus alba]MTH44748.1 hypothetical protein [Intestinirhabdus alba]